MQYVENFVRSAIEPETIVADVAQKTVWKMTYASAGYPASSATSQCCMKKSGVPMIPPTSVPNMSEKPMIQNAIVPMDRSMRFFMTIFPAFFARVNPVSTIANPGCMKKTRAAPKRTHIVSTEVYRPALATLSAAKAVGIAARSAAVQAAVRT